MRRQCIPAGQTPPADRAAVFASQAEFLAHHKAPLLARDRAQEPST